ncbi:alcohol dehydrogenase 4 [Fusarium napiforme]|uniref:Alcohol dehydrogenase 4 n=1 Tax=Fusarium napiforme TaxID=42672 RepID=A0A8H5JS28_9HYPO|nr:alcohol dehydrogenase 4 [Fusarium napiforme]
MGSKRFGDVDLLSLRCKCDPKYLEARHLRQTGVVEAMRAVSSGVPLGASHAIGHQLGPSNVGHGKTSGIFLPAVRKLNACKNAKDWQRRTVDIPLEKDTAKSLLADKGAS